MTEQPGTHAAQAPGQFLGYSLQAIVFLLELVNAPEGSTVSLEYFGDVGVENPNQTTAVEVKSGLATNPISNRSIGFWKTLANWIREVEAGHLQAEKTQFTLYVAQPKDGAIAQSFNNAATLDEAAAALALAEKELLDPERPLGEELAPHVKHVFSHKDTAQPIIARFHLQFGSGASQKDLEGVLTTKKYILPELLNPVVYQLQGWTTAQINTAIEQGRPAAITVEDFRFQLMTALRKYSFQPMLVSLAPNPTPEQIEANQASTFVQQLELIECEDERQLRAINDYFKAAIDRTEWSKSGMVHKGSFDELEATLIRFWENTRSQVELALAHLTEGKRGQYLYNECGKQTRTLQGMETPEHFVPGSYHALADQVILGWHPRFRDYFKEI
jgi:hypothetical protein